MGRSDWSDKAEAGPPSASTSSGSGASGAGRAARAVSRPVRGVVIRVQDFPDDTTLDEMDLESPFDLLGLYHGVPVGHGSEFAPPRQDVDMIFLYRRPLLDYWCETGAPLADIVRNTLIHEIGHHFGYSDDDMEEIEFGGG